MANGQDLITLTSSGAQPACRRKAVLPLLTAVLSLFLAGPPAGSATAAAHSHPALDSHRQKVTVAGLPQGPLIVEMVDGGELVDQMCKAARDLSNYSFQSVMTVYKKHGPVKEVANFYFKKPRLIRVEVTAGEKKGALAVLRADGKVRAHLGGLLKLFVVTLDPHAAELNSANGYPMVDSDFLSIAEFLQNWLKQGIRSRVSADPMQLDGSNMPVYVLEMYKGNDQRRVLKRVFVDAKTYLPVEWYDYQGAELWSKSVFKNVRTNIGLKDDLFRWK